jgi:alkylation response protein AidB-like acyl-CoA dehydrogenase
MAQSRLGPGRLHHCSRLVGHGERAIEEILKRGSERQAFGSCLLDLGGNNEKLGQCRIVLRLAKLSLIDSANELDRHDNDISNNHGGNNHDKQVRVGIRVRVRIRLGLRFRGRLKTTSCTKPYP